MRLIGPIEIERRSRVAPTRGDAAYVVKWQGFTAGVSEHRQARHRRRVAALRDRLPHDPAGDLPQVGSDRVVVERARHLPVVAALCGGRCGSAPCRGTARPAPRPSPARRRCRRCRTSARSRGTRTGSCSRRRRARGIFTLRNIAIALTASSNATSCGVQTTTAPVSGKSCDNVSAMSPVPGGMSMIR